MMMEVHSIMITIHSMYMEATNLTLMDMQMLVMTMLWHFQMSMAHIV